jgi:hypothetical protein
MTTRTILTAIATLLAGTLCALPTEASSAADAYASLRQAELDGRTIPVEDVTIERDAFEIRFGNGQFHLLAPVEGRTLGAIFVGDGEYRLRPVTPGEQYAVAFRANEDALEMLTETFDRMVLLFTDGTAEELLGDSEPVPGAPDPEAAQVFQKYTKWQREDYRTNVQLRMIEDLFNDTGRDGGYFLALARGQRFERSLIEIDPLGVLDDEEVCLIGYEKNDVVGVWYSSHLKSEIDAGVDADCGIKVAADARHYELETRIYSGTDLEGTTTIHLTSRIPELQVLAVGLLPSLLIEEVVRLDPDGGEPVALEFVQEHEDEDGNLSVFLDAPLDEGQESTLRFRYDGKGVLVADGDGLFRVQARSNWYPHLGDFSDRATYDLSFESPKGKMLVSVGELIDRKEEGDAEITRWKVEQPMVVAGFNYGKFRETEQKEEDSGTTIRVYTNPGTPDVIAELNAASTGFESDRLSIDNPESYSSGTGRRFSASTEKLAENVMADATNSLRVYSKYFGKLPFDDLSLTQQSEFLFGQAWPSLIFIPYVAALEPLTRQALGLGGEETSNFVDEVIIHEVAHQWWGHQVGWASYRDQWLSEGFAEFSAALVLELTRGQKAADDFWMRWRSQLLTDPSSKRELAAIYAGPVTQGYRLDSERNPLAYQKVVYGKGAFVLQMLRMMMRDPKSADPDGKFFAMMKDFAQTYSGREATTEDFKAMVEKHIVPNLNATRDGKVDWFFNQWVYGIEVPTYRVDMDIEKAGGGQYRLFGTVSQESVSDEFMAMVPLYVDLGKGQYGMIGRAPFKGSQTHKIDTTLKLPNKPKDVLVNAHYEVLAWDPSKKKK